VSCVCFRVFYLSSFLLFGHNPIRIKRRTRQGFLLRSSLSAWTWHVCVRLWVEITSGIEKYFFLFLYFSFYFFIFWLLFGLAYHITRLAFCSFSKDIRTDRKQFFFFVARILTDFFSLSFFLFLFSFSFKF
jgi:hypothetical protein